MWLWVIQYEFPKLECRIERIENDLRDELCGGCELEVQHTEHPINHSLTYNIRNSVERDCEVDGL